GAARLWELLRDEDYVAVLSAITGNQAIQQVQAGLKAIYVSGWQVAADANHALEMYPDQSLYPSDSVPALLRRINNALKRADQIAHLKDDHATYWFAPLVADAEAGFGGPLHAFEVMKNMIDAGAAGVHFEDQLASVKKCGHLGGKVHVPTSEFITKLVAARLATDVSGVDTILIARTDANSATLITRDCDEYDHRFVTGDRTAAGYFRVRHAVRVPRVEPQHVRAGQGVPGQGDGRLLGATESRVRVGEGRLRGGAAPGVRGCGLFRRDHSDRDRRAIVGDRDGGLDGAAA